ncbi:hypothetical protein HAZT_HAZT009449 [Hyalella azteca]|uniref:RNA (guanine-9-)-methyltransferase domain-containing protein 1 n=1 Tax=Hyalella azteca TaxID=294128 RepID=A0A6A0H2H5_HYAAZ|nr:hypothetical protein HAZT_HAZT009449 [Hyalella azteca]
MHLEYLFFHSFPSTRPFSSISPANVRQLVTCYQAPRSVPSLLNARYKNSWTQSDLASTLTEEEKMTLVKAEYELYRAEEETQVPSSLTENEWEELARLPGVSRRKKYLRFLYLNEMKSINDKKKKLERRKISEAKYQQLQVELKSESAHISYGLWRNSMFIKWSDQRVNTVDSHRVVQAKLFGQPIIFDYDFDEKMVAREKKVLGTQVAECIGMNRQYLDPFYIHFCNFRREEESAQLTIKSVPTLTNEDFLVDLHPDNFLEVFPREKLVYLTPHCREEVREFDHDAVYIIGGLVDLRSDEPFTLAKAKRQRIKMQKLPLDRCVTCSWSFMTNFSGIIE